jgi:hypothetical protein
MESVREMSSSNYQTSRDPFLEFRSTKLTTLDLILRAPLTVYNQICQTLLYRYANSEGFVYAEGAINPCESVDIFSLPKLFEDRFYLRYLLAYTHHVDIN